MIHQKTIITKLKERLQLSKREREQLHPIAESVSVDSIWNELIEFPIPEDISQEKEKLLRLLLEIQTWSHYMCKKIFELHVKEERGGKNVAILTLVGVSVDIIGVTIRSKKFREWKHFLNLRSHITWIITTMRSGLEIAKNHAWIETILCKDDSEEGFRFAANTLKLFHNNSRSDRRKENS